MNRILAVSALASILILGTFGLTDAFAGNHGNNGNNGCENANPNAKACEKNPNTTNTPPTIGSVSILVNGVDVAGGTTQGGPLECAANDVTDVDDDIVTFTFKWIQDGAVISTENIVSDPPTPIGLGTLLTCEITPFDGTDFGDTVSATTLYGCPPFC